MSAPWFPHVRPAPGARIRLYCFPYAGGSASSFRTWRERLSGDIAVWAVQPPGRERRLGEPLLRTVDELVEALLPDLRPRLQELPFVFFGHSLGALVACAVTRRLAAEGGPLPARLLVSGSRPPHVPRERPELHALPEAEFRAGLQRLGGTPSEVLGNEELMELFTPLLRADLGMSERYLVPDRTPLAVPIWAFGGADDEEVSLESLAAWRELAGSDFRSHILPGGHFFLHSAETQLLEAIEAALLGEPGPGAPGGGLGGP